jgi:predicted RND superfamily exporter protein
LNRAKILEGARQYKKGALAALTTFAGFISFAFAPLNAIRDFGIFAAFGVVTAS